MTQQIGPAWTTHSAFGSPRNVAGILPRHGAHFLFSDVSSAPLAVTLEDLAYDTPFLN